MINLNIFLIFIIGLFIILNNNIKLNNILLNNTIIKIIILLIIIIISNDYKTISILLTLAFVLTLNYNKSEYFTSKKNVGSECKDKSECSTNICNDKICSCPPERIMDGVNCIRCPYTQITNDGITCECPPNLKLGNDNKCYCPDGLILDNDNNCVSCAPGLIRSDVNRCYMCQPGKMPDSKKTSCIPCSSKSKILSCLDTNLNNTTVDEIYDTNFKTRPTPTPTSRTNPSTTPTPTPTSRTNPSTRPTTRPPNTGIDDIINQLKDYLNARVK